MESIVSYEVKKDQDQSLAIFMHSETAEVVRLKNEFVERGKRKGVKIEFVKCIFTEKDDCFFVEMVFKGVNRMSEEE